MVLSVELIVGATATKIVTTEVELDPGQQTSMCEYELRGCERNVVRLATRCRRD
jgi:hypothetical protein